MARYEIRSNAEDILKESYDFAVENGEVCNFRDYVEMEYEATRGDFLRWLFNDNEDEDIDEEICQEIFQEFLGNL